MNKRFITGLFCALAGGAQAADDPMVEYRQACEAPHYEALSVLTHPTDDTPVDWDAAARPCRAFLQRLEEAEPEDPLARFALYRAKSWLDGHQGDPCAEVAEIVDSLPDNADALFEWWVLCDDDDSLLKQTVRAGHPHARDMLLSDVVHQGNYYGFPAETLARYAEEAYQDALYVTDRYHAARAIYEIALDTGDTAAAKAIQDRMVHDLGLAYDPAHRGQSLERMCGRWMFNMDLEGRLCVSALEALAAEALARGEAIPDDVLLHLGTAFGEAEHKAFFGGRRDRRRRSAGRDPRRAPPSPCGLPSTCACSRRRRPPGRRRNAPRRCAAPSRPTPATPAPDATWPPRWASRAR